MFTSKQLKEEITSLEAAVTELQNERAALIKDHADALEDLNAKVATFEKTAKEQDEKMAALESEKEKAAEKVTLVEANATAEAEKIAAAKVVDTLAAAGADLSLADGAAAEDAIQGFEARYEEAKAVGGVTYSKFIRENKAEIKDFLNTKN